MELPSSFVVVVDVCCRACIFLFFYNPFGYVLQVFVPAGFFHKGVGGHDQVGDYLGVAANGGVFFFFFCKHVQTAFIDILRLLDRSL